MYYVNEYTNKRYDNKEDCIKAEKDYLAKVEAANIEKEKKLAARKEAAEKVEAARQAMMVSQEQYKKELKAFCDAYGAYHYTTKSIDEIPHLFDIFNLFT